MKPVERVFNLFILLSLNIFGIVYELYLNGVPLMYVWSWSALVVPIFLTVQVGVLGEVLFYIRDGYKAGL